MKRGVSPVVTTIFLFAIILGAIAVSIGLIYPQLTQLDEQIAVESTGTAIISLDNDIQTLLLNGIDGNIYKNIELSNSGLITVDQNSLINVSLFEVGTQGLANLVYSENITHSRFQIFDTVTSDNVITAGSHRYLRGGADDANLFFLNTTNSNKLPWSIVNQSRAIGSDEVSTSLSYRNLAKKNTFIDSSALMVNYTIEIQVVNMILGGANSDTGASFQITINYQGTQTTLTDWMSINSDVILRTSTLLSDPDSTSAIEYPIHLEQPRDSTSGTKINYNVRFKFVYYQLEITI